MNTYNSWVTRFSGQPVGSLMKIGYLSVSLDGKTLLMHRVLWFMRTGEIPDQIDHINGDMTDNRLENLRDVGASKNSENSKMYSNNSTGFRGVHYYKARNKYTAHITRDYKTKSLGYFDTAEEAHQARLSAEREMGYENYRGD